MSLISTSVTQAKRHNPNNTMNLRVRFASFDAPTLIEDGFGHHWRPGGEGVKPHIAFAGHQLFVLSFGEIPEDGPPSSFLTDGYDVFREESRFSEMTLLHDGNDHDCHVLMLTLLGELAETFDFEDSGLEKLDGSEINGAAYGYYDNGELLLVISKDGVDLDFGDRTLTISLDPSAEHGVKFAWSGGPEEEEDAEEEAEEEQAAEPAS